MSLPHYFLADLPAEATLTPKLLAETCAALKHNRRHYLVTRTTDDIIGALVEVAAGWLQPEGELRQLALDVGPVELGFSRPTLARGLDEFFRQLTRENFERLLEQEFSEVQRLDELVASRVERASGKTALATGPGLLVHIAAGNIPNPTLTSMIFGLLVRSAQVVKCGRGTTLLPRLFAHSLYRVDPKLAACLEVVEWPGGATELEQVLWAVADCVTATGRDETLVKIQRELPHPIRFLGHGHRLSFGYVARDLLNLAEVDHLVRAAADDVTAWDQLGCLSPHVFFVQNGGALAPEQFAAKLAGELERCERTAPRGGVPTATAAIIATRRQIYQMRSAQGEATHVWQSPDSTAWTVVCEAESPFPVSCLHRFIHIRPVSGVTEVLQVADAHRRQVSTVGLAVPRSQWAGVARQLGRWGASRICPLGQMQRPPLTWRQDGRPALADLVTWTDCES
ncbi:MAG TPA: acyl-CoA reductase [Verrucomicrobiota bacterium]|nr:acyl-CoA reductase [Verrucomicrobiota bacterium]HNT15861.1 acyl-CoA reductase [Verrucomicrobiota bacterium]